MPKMVVKLTLPGRLMREPVIYTIAHDYSITFTIRRGRFTEKSAWVHAEMEGTKREMRKVLDFLEEKGVRIEICET